MTDTPYHVHTERMLTRAILRHDVFMAVWKGRTSPDGILEHPLIKFAKDMSVDELVARNFKLNWATPFNRVLEYMVQILCWARVAAIREPDGGFNGVEYARSKIRLRDALCEDLPAEAVIGWNGEELFDLLSVKLTADPESEVYKKAYEVVWTILTTSSLQKVNHAAELTSTKSLGALWDMEQNEGKDHEPGTFAELLRYGSVHFQQNREVVHIKLPDADFVLDKGVLEP